MSDNKDLPRQVTPERPTILFVCTGNQCRSPMASAILAHLLRSRGSDIGVQSAGFVSEGARCPPEVVRVMSVLGYDLTAHKSRIVRDSMLKTAAVILGMTRQQLIELSLREPDGWTRAFTFAELVRLAEAKGPRSPGEPLDLWISRVGRDRVRSGALNLPLAEDIPDPIGKPFRAYARTRDQLLELATRLADLLQPV